MAEGRKKQQSKGLRAQGNGAPGPRAGAFVPRRGGVSGPNRDRLGAVLVHQPLAESQVALARRAKAPEHSVFPRALFAATAILGYAFPPASLIAAVREASSR